MIGPQPENPLGGRPTIEAPPETNAGRHLKPSAYNFRTALPDGTVLFFNFFTLNLMALDASEARQAAALLDAPAIAILPRSHGLHQQLLEKGFLIPVGVQEKDYLRNGQTRARQANRHLSLTIIPTLACNFRCRYCYQEHQSATMGPAVEDALLHFIEKRLGEGGTLSVTWFGGEPLLQINRIEWLTAAFRRICDQHKARYASHIITNGYLLDRPMAERLKACRVNHAQVTLDGPPAVHDQRRPLADGSGTFDAILANMEAAAPLVPINLRINVDQTNREAIPDILQQVAHKGLTGAVHPYLGRTYPYTGVCLDVAGDCLADADFSLLELETTLKFIDQGFPAYRAPRAISTYCMAEKANAFVVTPHGRLLKCWNEASDASAAVGHLIQAEDNRMRRNAKNWRPRDIFRLECADCRLLPICMGGCPYLYHQTGRLHCHPWKSHPDESLAVYYYMKRLERERDIALNFSELVTEVKSAVAPS